MKKISCALCTLLAAIVSLQAQSFVELSQTGENFYTIQKLGNEYWATKNIDSVRGWKAFRRWEEFWEPRVYPSGEFPDGMHIWKEWQKLKAKQDPALHKGANRSQAVPAWRLLGPTQKVPTGGGAGRLCAIRFDPDEPEIIWVGAPAGGLWKSTNLGRTWTTTTDSLPNLGVTDIAINPKNTRQMFISTGDGDGSHTNSYGVLRSDDGGKTWNLSSLGFTMNQGRQTSRLVIHPAQPNILVCATSNGLYRTTNSGQTWSSVLTGNFKDIELKPDNPNVMYACAGAAIHKSVDAGATWARMSQGLPTSGIARIALGVSPADPEIVYALLAASNNGFYGVYRSNDAGASWSKMSSTPNILGWRNDGNDAGGQGGYDLAITVSQTNPDIVFCGGVNIWLSTDGGSTWKISAHWQGSGAPYVHADCHALEAVPGEEAFFAGTDGGIFYTTDYGKKWTDVSHGLQILQFYRIGANPIDSRVVIGGCQDNGTNRYADGDWRQVNGADGMEAFIENDGKSAYSTYYYGRLFRSSDGGLTFPSQVTPPSQGAWITPYIMNPLKNSSLYCGMRSVYKSTNRGSNWTTIGQSSVFNTQLAALGMSTGDTNKLYAASSTQLWLTTNGGTQWNSITGSLTASGASISNIAVHPTNSARVAVTFSGYGSTNKVALSSNNGGKWTDITKSGLPAVPVNCAVFYSDKCGEYLFVGTDLGVFYTTDDLQTWVDYNNGLPNVIIRDFEVTGDLLRAGTFGRGLWEIQIPTPAPTAKFSVAKPSICVGDVVQYFDESTGIPGSVEWEFEGGIPAQSTQRSPSVTYNTPGKYRVHLKVNNNCGADSLVLEEVISVLARPAKPVVSRNVNTLSVSGGNSYQWYKDGIAITGATSSSYTISSAGTYTVKVTDENGCTTISDENTLVVGIETASGELETQWEVYPNPTDGRYTVRLHGVENGTDFSLRVTSVSGTVIEEHQGKTQGALYTKQLTLGDMPPGTYIVEIRCNGKRAVRKIVKR